MGLSSTLPKRKIYRSCLSKACCTYYNQQTQKMEEAAVWENLMFPLFYIPGENHKFRKRSFQGCEEARQRLQKLLREDYNHRCRYKIKGTQLYVVQFGGGPWFNKWTFEIHEDETFNWVCYNIFTGDCRHADYLGRFDPWQ